ncbi:MAG TPA: hypothetical protein VMY37_20680 [Thermoguttaceae bacterium]|nr:hypothetical protein [Thermoguttaceae bacterium]
MTTGTKAQPADELAKLAETTETRYRELITALARGESVDQQQILQLASATGRNLSMMRTHRDRLAARIASAEQLKDETATERVRESQASAERGEQELAQARAKATKMVADATEACEQAKADYAAAFSEAQRVLDDARRTLAESADPAIDREVTTLRKGHGLQQLEAAKGHNPGMRVQVAEKGAAMRSLAERKADPIDGMDWT